MSNILIFDTETTGLPKRKSFDQYHDPKKLKYYDSSRVIEIGYIIYNENGEKIKENCFLIKPNNFKIENTHIHGISQIDADLNGIEIKKGLEIFNNDLKNIKVLVAYNCLFDIHVLMSECYRNEYTELIKTLKTKKIECCMKLAQTKLSLLRYMKLKVLYETLFKTQIIQQHRALSDCEICGKCYFKLINY
tara:strand:+ start:73 stop:645 length:573 start_codon:yes stop_codon:yes gene_type:complete